MGKTKTMGKFKKKKGSKKSRRRGGAGLRGHPLTYAIDICLTPYESARLRRALGREVIHPNQLRRLAATGARDNARLAAAERGLVHDEPEVMRAHPYPPGYSQNDPEKFVFLYTPHFDGVPVLQDRAVRPHIPFPIDRAGNPVTRLSDFNPYATGSYTRYQSLLNYYGLQESDLGVLGWPVHHSRIQRFYQNHANQVYRRKLLKHLEEQSLPKSIHNSWPGERQSDGSGLAAFRARLP